MSSLYPKLNTLLVRRPIVTNCILAGCVFSSGDVLAQTCFTDASHKYDPLRTARAMIYGIMFAPIGDSWYKVVGKLKNPLRVNSPLINNLVRVLYDQLIFAPIVGVPLYYTVMSFLKLDHDPIQRAWNNLQNNWWPTLKSNWMVWPAFQAVNFIFVPLQLRLLASSLFGIGWNCYLSYILHHNEPTQIPVKEDQII